MCFWKRKKQEDKQEEPNINKLREMEKAAHSLSLMAQHSVTRLDETEAYVKALVSLHPEVKEHPAVIDLIRREEEYKKEKAGEN